MQRALDFLAGRSGYRETYVSEPTRLIQEYLAQHPEELESQRKGRAIWWDKYPGERAPSPSMRHAPKAGGNEHTFVPIPSGGGAEYMFGPDDNTEK
ncbi:MAG TPA: DUF3460 family protein [Burkholderiales bacterium]